MSNRSKNLLAAVAVFGMAAIASSQGLTNAPAPAPAPAQQMAAASPLVQANFTR